MTMSKLGQVVMAVGITSILYLLMIVVMPILTDFASTANTTMAATSNVSNYPGAQEGVLAAPWGLWFVPGAICMVAIVAILKRT